MSASRYFRRMLAVAGFTMLLFLAAVVSPLLVGRLLAGDAIVGQDDILTCLIVPTFADWPSHVLSYALAGLLSIGVLAGVLSFAQQWYRTRRTVMSLIRLSGPVDEDLQGRLSDFVGLQGRVDFIGLDKPVAFCYGWFYPRICLSTGAVEGLNTREIEALLLHEYHHLLRRDPLKTAISRALASTFFFLPVIRALQGQFLLAKEIEADQYALRAQGSDRPLLGALYKLLLRQAQPRIRMTSGLAIAGAVDAINQRLDYLLDNRAPLGPRLLSIFVSSCMIAAIATVLGVTTWSAAASALWYQAHSSLGGC